jgi:hypothetical protein
MGTKVPVAWGIKGVVRPRRSALIVSLAVYCTDIPVGPSGQGRCAGDVACGSFKPVNPVQRVRVPCSCQKSEEHQQKSSGRKEKA